MRIFGCVSVALSLTACSTFQKQAAVSPLSVIEAKVEFCSDLRTQQQDSYDIEVVCGSLPTLVSEGDDGKKSYISDPKAYVINLMMVSDRVCARELGNLSANQRTVNAALSTTSTVFSSAASIVTGGLADNILSGLSTLAGSTRDHISAEVYRQAQPELLTRLIQAQRVLIAEKIAARSNASTFSWQQAVSDANTYYQACSYYQGLALLTDSANEKAQEMVRAAQELKPKEAKALAAGDTPSENPEPEPSPASEPPGG